MTVQCVERNETTRASSLKSLINKDGEDGQEEVMLVVTRLLLTEKCRPTKDRDQGPSHRDGINTACSSMFPQHIRIWPP